jgi:hypothetical protein
VSLSAPSQQTGRTRDRISTFQLHVPSLELATYRPVRAPPTL